MAVDPRQSVVVNMDTYKEVLYAAGLLALILDRDHPSYTSC